MQTNNKYRNLFFAIYQYYCNNIYDISDFNFDNIHTCGNIHDGLKSLGVHEYIDNAEGVSILPSSEKEPLRVLIEITSKTDIAKVLIHEFTHVYDIIQYAKYYNNNIITDFHLDKLYTTYMCYSEFHAHALDEYEGMKLQDLLLKTNNLNSVFEDYDQLMNKYIEDKQKGYFFNAENIFILMGKLYRLDELKCVSHLEKSCALHYLAKVFHSDRKYEIFEWYRLCWDSMKNHNIFENLERLDSLLRKTTTKV